MSEANAITLAFLARQPKAAAALLQRFPPEQAADFLRDAPLTSLMPVMREMASWPATRVLSRLPTTLVANVLRELPASKSETLLRLLDDELRDEALRHLPKSLAKSFKRKLVYTPGTTGAHMDVSAERFTPDDTVADCVDLVRQRKSSLGGALAVVDYDRKFIGMVEVEQLLTGDRKTLLSELVSTDLEPLSAQATLGEVMNDNGWTRFSALPVVDRGNILLGVLTHRAMLAGRKGHRRLAGKESRFSLLANLGRAFFVATTGLLNIGWGLSGHSGPGAGSGSRQSAGDGEFTPHG